MGRGPLLALLALLGSLLGPVDTAAQSGATPAATLIYSGRSLGALGVLRDPDEHDLLLEQATREGIPVQLATMRGWRSPGFTLFSPGADLSTADLQTWLAAPPTASGTTTAALISGSVTLLQPTANGRDLLALALANPRAAVDFPDLARAQVRIADGRTAAGQPWFLVAEGAPRPAPTDPTAWSSAEINRITLGGAVAYELVVNLGQMGPRATILDGLVTAARAAGAEPILIDLGHRDGDLGLERGERARLDFRVLQKLGYRVALPYELELGLGAAGLAALTSEFPALTWLASNVRAPKHPSLFRTRTVIAHNDLRIGFFALIDPELRSSLASEALAGFSFEAPVDAAKREIAALRQEGADVVILLSNLPPRDNAFIARETAGLDAVVADLHVRWSPEDVKTTVIRDAAPRRPGSPAMITRSLANGLGIGALELRVERRAGSRPVVTELDHRLVSVTDRTLADSTLVAEVRRLEAQLERPRGPVILPAFTDLVARRPTLAQFDETTAIGRVSKRMWEEGLARLIRRRARAEVAVLRKLPHFPPAIGALHESDVRAWLWTEDTLAILDLSGADLRALLRQDVGGDLVTSGIDRAAGTIHGRRIEDTTFYRVATTDLLIDGVLRPSFARARRVNRSFRVAGDGAIERSGGARALAIRDLVLGDLTRLAATMPAAQAADEIAALLDRDPAFEPVFVITFERPTIAAAANQASNPPGYGAVPESRVLARDSSVFSASGRFLASRDQQRFRVDLGFASAFSQLSAQSSARTRIVTESADDFKVDVTARRKVALVGPFEPFLRTVFDSEFTRTTNVPTGQRNPRQRVFRTSGGLSRPTGPRWQTLEVAAVLDRDLARGSTEYGLEVRADYRRPFGPMRRLTYRMRHEALGFLPASDDDETDLGVIYNMVHELVIPLVDELAVSVAADVFVFRGKVPTAREVGTSAIVRVGLTYDRIWKPRYQPF